MRMDMEHIILASGSPRRREILEKMGYAFRIITSDTDEHTDKDKPYDIVMELSRRKALAVCGKADEDAVIIGADTIVYYDGEVLLKPVDREDAYNTLRKLSGQVHQVYTGVTIVDYKDKKQRSVTSFFEKTDVEFYPLTDEEIESYIATGDPMDKAGAYGIQGIFGKHIKGICGDYTNVVGLPAGRLYMELKKLHLQDEDNAWHKEII